MKIYAVEGSAGCGKTVRLMDQLAEALAGAPLGEGQRVLALTFMHGARRRLHDRLRSVPGLRGRVECVTVDSFAQRLLRRWRGLAAALGFPMLAVDQYDDICDAAGALLERPEVRDWVGGSFPIVLVDEAQDLKPQRLRMIRGLAGAVHLLIAADEFQCLDPALRPNPLVAWLRQAADPITLTKVHRTNVPALLTAAGTIRGGGPAATGQGFQISAAKGVPMAAAYVANAFAWRKGGNVAVITPSLSGAFARDVVERVCQQACGKQGNGPYAIRWDRSDDEEFAALVERFDLAATATLQEALASLGRLPQSLAIREAAGWVRRQAHAAGRVAFDRHEIEAIIARQITMRRQRHGAGSFDFVAMTVQQAKNREFEGVVVLWPFRVGGDAEHKRRLLYNAITRARRWCAVVVQGDELLKAPPFA